MADNNPKPRSRGPAPTQRRSTSRLTVAGRLMALVGLPVLVIASIFAGGLYVGATRSYRVRTLEATWLGLAPPAGAEEASSGGEPEVGGEVGAGEAEAGESGEAPEAETEAGEADSGATKEPSTEPSTEPVTEPSTKPTPSGLEGVAVVSAAAVGPELRARFDEELTIRVKIVVDPALAVTRDDWLAYVDRMFASVRSSFEVLAGVELRLHGVVLWDVGSDADDAALLADLQQRERDGADVILGLVARTRPADRALKLWTGDENGDHALIYADLGRRDRYYHDTLRALALLLGAEPTTDPSATERGSFMSPAAPDATPMLDPENRGKIIINKRRPFFDSADEVDSGVTDDDTTEEN